MLGMIVFFATTTLITLAIHRYLWMRLVRDPSWPPRVKRGLGLAVILLGASMVLAFPLARMLPRPLAQIHAVVAFTWMGLALGTVVLLLVVDLARLLRKALPRSGQGPVDPARRVFLARSVAIATGATAAGLAGLGAKNALGEIDVREVPVRIPKLPAALSGFTIVQLTDLHIGPLLGRRWIEAIVEKVNALRPDLVAITGDLMDGRVQEIGDQVSPIGRLRARHGVFFVTGNHEYYSGVSEWLAELRRLGVRPLENERVALDAIDLAGVHDYSAARSRFGILPPGLLPDLPAALAGRDPERALVLLAHQPRAIEEASALGVDLQLSGHTHGGQIWPFGELVKPAQIYITGLHRHGGAQIYVSRGAGFWGPPMRLGAPAEISKIVLVA